MISRTSVNWGWSKGPRDQWEGPQVWTEGPRAWMERAQVLRGALHGFLHLEILESHSSFVFSLGGLLVLQQPLSFFQVTITKLNIVFFVCVCVCGGVDGAFIW